MRKEQRCVARTLPGQAEIAQCLRAALVEVADRVFERIVRCQIWLSVDTRLNHLRYWQDWALVPRVGRSVASAVGA